MHIWLNDNKIIVVEADKGRTTCKIGEENVKEMIKTELKNQNRYHSFKKRQYR